MRTVRQRPHVTRIVDVCDDRRGRLDVLDFRWGLRRLQRRQLLALRSLRSRRPWIAQSVDHLIRIDTGVPQVI
jgi:hypothetical protein